MQVERRKRIRIMTLKNFGRALLVLLLALATANVVSEMRKTRPGEFGRLDRYPTDVTLKRPLPIVTEGKVTDEMPSMAPATLVSGAAAPPPPLSVDSRGGEGAVAPLSKNERGTITIVGGADGVRVEHPTTETTPKLSGGIFRIEN